MTKLRTLALSLSLCTFLSIEGLYASDEIAEDDPSKAIPRTSTHLEPYDITPYVGKTDDELFRLLEAHKPDPFRDSRETDDERFPFTDGGEYVRDCCRTQIIDDDWKAAANIYQTFSRRSEDDKKYLDAIFNRVRGGTFKMDEDLDRQKSHYPNPREVLFFCWKQSAWLNPHDADALAYALEHGFPGRIEARPEWAPYWRERARILRESTGWYIPSYDSILEFRPNHDMAKLYRLVRTERE